MLSENKSLVISNQEYRTKHIAMGQKDIER